MPGSPRIDLGEGFTRPHDLLCELRQDVEAAYKTLEPDRKSQYLRRCVVRAVFSYIEAIIESIKIELRSTVRTGQYAEVLADKDKETLGPLHIVGAEPGRFLPLDSNIRRTFRLAAKIWKLKTFKLDTGGLEFRDFLAAKSARNCLTHPRTFYDIEVNDLDMHCHTTAGMWVEKELGRLFEARIHALAEGLPVEDRASFIADFTDSRKSHTNTAFRSDDA